MKKRIESILWRFFFLRPWEGGVFIAVLLVGLFFAIRPLVPKPVFYMSVLDGSAPGFRVGDFTFQGRPTRANIEAARQSAAATLGISPTNTLIISISNPNR